MLITVGGTGTPGTAIIPAGRELVRLLVRTPAAFTIAPHLLSCPGRRDAFFSPHRPGAGISIRTSIRSDVQSLFDVFEDTEGV
jgi:hypothetical protein